MHVLVYAVPCVALNVVVQAVPVAAEAHFNLGAGAEQMYRKAIELDPSDAEAHLRRGDCDGAEKMYRKTIELDPSHAKAHGNLGTLLNYLRRDCYAAALKRSQTHPQMLNLLTLKIKLFGLRFCVFRVLCASSTLLRGKRGF